MRYENKYGLPISFVTAAQKMADSYDLRGRKDVVSVTSLIDSPLIRKLWLEHDNEIVVDIVEDLRKLKGQAYHLMLEMGSDGLLVEKRFEANVEGLTISGKVDLFDHENRTLIDYKVTHARVVYFHKGKCPHNYMRQLQVNAWLMRQNGIDVQNARICFWFDDWKALDYEMEKDRGYPEREIIFYDVDLSDMDEVYNYICKRVKLHKAVINGEFYECDEYERWDTNSKYKVFNTKNLDRAISGGIFDDEFNALAKVRQLEEDFYEKLKKSKKPIKNQSWIVRKVNGDKRCRSCNVKSWCSYYKQNYSLSIPGEEITEPSKD